LAQGLGLLFQQGGQSAFGEAGGRRTGQSLQGLEIGVQAGAGLAEGPAGDDFAPARGEVADFLEEFRRKFTSCHRWYLLVLAAKVPEGFLTPL
jgi:hypothetical protein